MSKQPRLADVVRPYLADQCDVLLGAADALRGPDNVVHPTRVAVRRLRSTLRVFPELFDVPLAAQLDEDLEWWAGLLGEVRDLDILGARLEDQLGALPADLVLGPVSATIQAEIAARRSAAMAAVVEGLESERYAALLTRLRRWRTDPPLTSEAERKADRIGGLVRRAGRKLSRRLDQAVADREAGEPAHELFHRARKAGKRHRYAAELATPVLGAKAERIVARRKELQDVLGDHQDGILAAAFLRELGGQLGVRCGVNGFTYGLLHGRELAADESLLQRLAAFR